MTDNNITAFNPAARLADETVAKIRAVAKSATAAEKRSVHDLISRASKSARESTVVTLTPAMCAILFLDHNPHNRDWRPATTLECARGMGLPGAWQWTNQGIGFYTDGLLEDGQHRLSGAAIAGFNWETPCTFGVEKESIVNVDVGNKRFASDAAKLAGVNDAKTKQTIIKSAAAYLDKSGDVPLPHRSEAEIERAIRSEDRHLDQAIEIGNHSLVLRCMTTVLNSVLDRGFIFSGGACHGGKNGHASLRLPRNGGGSLHGHRNGPCDAPAIGVVKSLLPTAAPNGWHSVLASRDGTA